MTVYDEIMTRLETLDKNDLKRLSSYISCLIGVSHVTDENLKDEAELYQALHSFLESRGIDAPPWAIFHRTKDGQLFKKNCGMIRPFIKSLSTCKKIERQSLIQTMFQFNLQRVSPAKEEHTSDNYNG